MSIAGTTGRSVLRIATRSSPLALWQARHVARRLEEAEPGLVCELLEMTTTGDRFLNGPLQAIGGKGLFVKELEQALLDARADLAVHSMKDVPAELPDGLHIGAILERASPLDALVTSSGEGSFERLPPGARVGSSSLRRRSQLLAWRPDVELVEIRGNVGTRLGKLDRGEVDALVLAQAGLERLGLGQRVTEVFAPERLLPAIGQGALGIECRVGDARVGELVGRLRDPATEVALEAERALNRALGGGCHVPVAGFAVAESGELTLTARIGSLDGRRLLEVTERGSPGEAARVGEAAARALLARGGQEILAGLGGPPR